MHDVICIAVRISMTHVNSNYIYYVLILVINPLAYGK